MSLAPPNLDDRTFQQLVDEAKRRIPAYIDGWTDHNVSDPGVTLIELFAWMTEIILYRQNQIPDWLTVKMMQLFGMKLDEPKAAKTAVTFQFSAPQPEQKTIPIGTEVATTQTETTPSIIFSTDKEITVFPAELERVLLHRQAQDEVVSALDVAHVQERQQTITLFSQQPIPRDAIYFGFAADLSHHLLHFFFECEQEFGTDGIDITRPPYGWEGASLDENGELIWQPCAMERDETRGMLWPGRMMIHLPQLQQTAVEIDNEKLFWLRLRVLDEADYEGEGIRPFTQSPRVQQITVASMGGTAPASHAEIIQREFLGYSDGSPGQRFWLQAAPILRPDGSRKETLLMQPPTKSEDDPAEGNTWVWVSGFGDYDLAKDAKLYEADEQHKQAFANRNIFTLDTATGELRLPPAQTDVRGNVQRYGQIPPRQSSLWFNQYRHGGGVIGNVVAYALNTLKTAVPYINLVYNREAAIGGQNQEPLEMAKLRAPGLLHAQNRAVTAADFEYLATQADVAVGRVKCLQHEPEWVESIDPGVVYLFLLPKVKEPAKPLSPSMLRMPAADRQKIKAYLDERRLLTMRLHVDQPEIVWARVKISCRVALGADKKGIAEEIEQLLYSYLNPLLGGPDPENAGWPFGRDLYTYDVYTCLQGIQDVLAIPEITLYQQLPNGTQKLDKGVLPVPSHGVTALAGYELQFVR